MLKTFSIFCMGFLILLAVGCNSRPVNSSIPLVTQSSVFNHTTNGIDMNDQPQRLSERILTDTYRGPVPILMYHSIGIDPKNTLLVAPKDFEAEMQHLKEAGYHTITFRDMERWKSGKPLPDKPILITFDDGYKDNYTIAYPILKKLNMKATIFVVTGFVGGKNNLSWEQIKEMQSSGLIEFGAHTKSHLDLTKLTPDEMKDQILGSKIALEAKLGQAVIAFAYPSGRYDSAVIKESQQAGFEFAVTTQSGYADVKQGLLTLHRMRVSGNESPIAFEKMFP